MLRLSKIFFVIFSSLACAILVMNLSRFFIPKNAGLAGGAMVLFYGLGGLVIGLIISMVLRNKLSSSILLGSNIVFSILITWFGLKIYQIDQKSKAEQCRAKSQASLCGRAPCPPTKGKLINNPSPDKVVCT